MSIESMIWREKRPPEWAQRDFYEHRPLVCELYAEDWRGQVVERYADGATMLDSGLFSKERKERGEQPVATLLIEDGTTGEQITDWLDSLVPRRGEA